MSRTIQAVIFDLDGTLANTIGDLTTAMNEMLTARHYPTRTLEQMLASINNGARNLVWRSLPEDVRDADVKKASAIISGLLRRSILNLVYGDHEAAVANERLARYIYRRYSQDNRDIKRNTLPPYTKLKENVVGESRKILPPTMVRLLDAAIAAERAETAGAAGGSEQK